MLKLTVLFAIVSYFQYHCNEPFNLRSHDVILHSYYRMDAVHWHVCVISGDCILFVCVHLEHHHHHCQSFLSKGEETGD
jgi:hypothetical protein